MNENIFSDGLDEPVRTDSPADSNPSAPVPAQTKWLSVAEAQVYLHSSGYQLSRQNIRKHCRNKRFDEVRIEPTANGARHEVTQASLDAFLADARREDDQANTMETNPVRTDSHPSVSVRMDANASERHSSEATKGASSEEIHNTSDAQTIEQQKREIERLEKELRSTQIEKAVAHQTRDYIERQATKQQTKLTDLSYQLGTAKAQLSMLHSGEISAPVDNEQHARIRDVQ